PNPTPTLNASNPSVAAPASSPSASCTRSGKLSRRPSCSCITAFMAVPFVSMDLFALATFPTGTDEANGTAAYKLLRARDNLGFTDRPGRHWSVSSLNPPAQTTPATQSRGVSAL